MAITLTQLLADVNDLLQDTGNTKVSEAQKIRYINRGQHAMWPKIYRLASDSTVVLVDETTEYAVPSALNEGILVGVEFESETDSGSYWQADGFVFDLLPTVGFGQKLILKNLDALPSEAGSKVRFTAALPLTALASGSDVFTGPSFSDELPVLYAMSLATARDYDARIDYRRFSTTQALNGVLMEDVQDVTNWWMRQFQIGLEQMRMPFPSL